MCVPSATSVVDKLVIYSDRLTATVGRSINEISSHVNTYPVKVPKVGRGVRTFLCLKKVRARKERVKLAISTKKLCNLATTF